MFRVFRNMAVITAKEGIHRFLLQDTGVLLQRPWIPAFAGMTVGAEWQTWGAEWQTWGAVVLDV